MSMTTQTPDAVREARDLIESITRPFPDGLNWEVRARACQEIAKLALAALDSRAGNAGEGLRKLAEEAALRMWSIHPNELDALGFVSNRHGGDYENPRAAYYASEIMRVVAAATPAPAVDALPSDGTCSRCGSAPRHPHTGLCATCADEDAPAVDAVPAGEVWRDIDEAARNGKYQWVGRSGDFPFADWLRWDGARWLFSDGAHMTEGYGKLVYHPLPAPPTDAAPECLCCGGSRQERYVGYGNSEEIRDCSVCGPKASLSHGEGRK